MEILPFAPDKSDEAALAEYYELRTTARPSNDAAA